MNLGGGRGVGSISSSGFDPNRKPGDADSDDFPAGLRVLVVDDDPTCLKILERMLVTCRYEVTKCNRVEYALNELRNNRSGFDVVISDVHMPNMDGFKLLEYVGLEMDLPVIMMSADDSKNVVMKGVKHGACDYLTKPVRMDALKNIWQHVVRRKKSEWQEVEPLDNKGQKHDANNEDNWKSSNRKGDDEEDDYAAYKKQRIVWTVELHQQFVAAVNHLGIEKAVPKKILELMDVPGLTRENVASHLQKYRLCLRKLTEEPLPLGGMSNSFMSPRNTGFGTMTSLGSIDLQSLTGYQAPLSRIPINPAISMPSQQTNAFGFETSNFRTPELQQLQQLSNNDKPSYSLYGNQTAKEPKQLSSFYQSAETLGSIKSQSNSALMQMILPQPLLSNGALVGVLPRNGSVQNNEGMPYNSVSQPPTMADFSANHMQDGVNLARKRSRDFDPNYDLFNELAQQKPQDWQTTSSSFVGVQHNPSIENITGPTSLLVNQGVGNNGNFIDGNKNVISTDPVVQQEVVNIQSGNNLPVDNVSSSVNPAEAVQELSSASNHYHFEFDQDDLLSVMLKQQEEEIKPVESDFNFDAYALDDILL